MRPRNATLWSVFLGLLAGCQSTSLNQDECQAFRQWAIAPPHESRNDRTIGFDWAMWTDEELPVYANIRGLFLDEHDAALYDVVVRKTHYIWLKDFAVGVARCFREPVLRERDADGNVTALDALFDYQNRRLTVTWRPVYCGTTEADSNGCVEISSTPLIQNFDNTGG